MIIEQFLYTYIIYDYIKFTKNFTQVLAYSHQINFFEFFLRKNQNIDEYNSKYKVLGTNIFNIIKIIVKYT